MKKLNDKKCIMKNTNIDDRQNDKSQENDKEKNSHPIIEEKEDIHEEKKDPRYRCVFF